VDLKPQVDQVVGASSKTPQSFPGTPASVNVDPPPNPNVNLTIPNLTFPNSYNASNLPVKVDTDTLTSFGSVVTTYASYVDSLVKQVKTVAIQPGDFYEADEMRAAFNYDTGSSSGLASKYSNALASLNSALTEISKGIHTLVKKYQSTEDLNNATATEVQTDFSAASSDISTMTSSAGGSSGGGSSSNS
jgi:hypothetical protein